MPSPPVTAAFLAAVSARTWSSANGGCLLDAAGAAWHPSIGRDGSWTLTASGDSIAQSVATALHGARAQGDGSFVAVGGARYWLAEVGGAAVSEVWGPPPPVP